jgi:hypothetical protein
MGAVGQPVPSELHALAREGCLRTAALAQPLGNAKTNSEPPSVVYLARSL